MEAIRQACSFVCDGLDFNADFPTKLRCDAHAPLLGALAPRRRRHCRRIVAFTAVAANIVVARRTDMPKKPKSAATPDHHDPETGEVVTPRDRNAEAKTAVVPHPRTGASRRTRAGGQDERRRERSAAAAA